MKNKMKRLNERINELVIGSRESDVNSYANSVGINIGDNENEVPLKDVLDEFNQSEEYVRAQFGIGDSKYQTAYANARMPFSEMVTTQGMQILMRRVISEQMLEPTEPNLWLTEVIADNFVLGEKDPLQVEFPQVGLLEATRMSEGQNYETQQMAFSQHMINQKVGKIGVACHLSEEVQMSSIYPLIGLYTRGMTNAISRRLESELNTLLTTASRVVFDNENLDANFRTTGRNSAQQANGTLSYFDLITMCGNIINSRYNPTHLIAHPLAWSILATDPILRAQMLNMGQIGGNIWRTAPQFDQTVNMPFGFTYVPYYGATYTPNDTLTGTFSGMGVAGSCDVYVVEAKKCLLVMGRGNTDLESYDDFFRDATVMKARRYVTPTALDNGKAMVAARNVRLATNFEPIYTIRSVSS